MCGDGDVVLVAALSATGCGYLQCRLCSQRQWRHAGSYDGILVVFICNQFHGIFITEHKITQMNIDVLFEAVKQ